MCDFENGFVLCSCKPEAPPGGPLPKRRRSKKSEQARKAGYRWTLSHLVGTHEAMMMGEYQMPSKELGAGLTSEWVLLHLNDGNCFDFEYTPQEGDNLILRSDDRWRYLSFVFRQGAWVEDHHDVFSTTLELGFEGKIEPVPVKAP